MEQSWDVSLNSQWIEIVPDATKVQIKCCIIIIQIIVTWVFI